SALRNNWRRNQTIMRGAFALIPRQTCMKRILSIALLAALSGCATPEGPAGDGADDARSDISQGHIRLMEAGTIGVYTPGVSFSDHRFDGVPRHTLPNGCTNPDAMYFVHYAECYNAVMIDYLAGHPMNAK